MQMPTVLWGHEPKPCWPPGSGDGGVPWAVPPHQSTCTVKLLSRQLRTVRERQRKDSARAAPASLCPGRAPSRPQGASEQRPASQAISRTAGTSPAHRPPRLAATALRPGAGKPARALRGASSGGWFRGFPGRGPGGSQSEVFRGLLRCGHNGWGA